MIDALIDEAKKAGRLGPENHPLVRPDDMEAEAVHRLLVIAKEAGAPVMVVHLTNKKALEEEKKRQLEEAAKALEEKHGDSKFKPTIMTYNDVTKTATPYEPENRDDDDEPAADPQDRDDDMPSEEELAVYDTDYLNADDEDSSGEEHDEEDHSSDEEK